MTSSNVSKLLVQVNQIDVSVNANNTNAVDNGLFEKTLKGVADKVPNAKSDSFSALPEKQPEKTAVNIDTSGTRKNIKQDEGLVEEKTQLVEKVETVVKEVKEIIEDQLEVTEEEIEKAMENLRLTIIDLFNPQNLAELVSELTGETESMTLVFSEDFAGILDKVTELTNQLFEETNNSFIELKDLLVQTEETNYVAIDEAKPPVDSEVPEFSEKENLVDTNNLTHEQEQQAVPVIREELKFTEKIETAAPEEEAAHVVETKEEIKPIVQDNNQQESNKSQSDKKDNEQTQFKVPVKVQNESNIPRGESILPPQQEFKLSYIPEESVVTLPTGETVKTEEIVSQLVEQARIMTDSESTTMEMTLNPEGLGKIYLEVTQKGGEITAKIFTENDAVKAALESQMAALRTEMNQTSAKVTSIEVSVGTHEFERNLDENGRDNSQNQEQSSERSAKRNSRIDINSLDDLSGIMSEEDMLIAQMMKDNGGTLDFMA